MASLIDRMMKSSTVKDTNFIGKAKYHTDEVDCPTVIPFMNAALSGDIDVGLRPGLNMIAAPSKSFKSLFALILAKAYLDKFKGKDPVILFYNNEFGIPKAYLDSIGIPEDRVLETPFDDIEELKHDLMNQIDKLTIDDNVIIVIDSLGMAASRKEVDDTMEGKVVADMTRAKAIKGLWRMITPKLKRKLIPVVAINHTYQEIGMFPKTVVGGGTGNIYAPNVIWTITKAQEKEGTDLIGSTFTIVAEKSRFVKEKSKFPITVINKEGVMKWSGFFDFSLNHNYLVKPNQGWYSKADPKTGEIEDKKHRRKDIENSDEFWNDMLNTTDIKEAIRNHYQLAEIDLIAEGTEFDGDADFEY